MSEPSPAGATSGDPLADRFRRQAGKLSRQASVFLAGTVFLAVGGYLFKIYVSRELGAAGLGIYAMGMALAGFAGLFTGLGLPQTAARYVAIDRGRGDGRAIRRFARRALVVLLISSGLAVAVLVGGRHLIAEGLFGEPALATYLPVFALILVAQTFHNFLGQFLRGLQEVARRTVINHFVLLPVKILVTVALFAAGWGVGGYVAGELGSLLLAIVLLVIVARRRMPEPEASSRPAEARPVREEARYAASMVTLAVLGYLTHQADVFLVGVFLETSRVGIYSVAVTTAAFVPILLKALNSIFGPMIADLHDRGQTELLARLFRTSTKWCLGLTWPLVAVLVFFAREMMSIFGPEFEAGASALALLALAQMVNVGVGSVGNLLVMSGHQRLEIASVGFTAALSLPLSLILIPRWGIPGAAAALAVSLSASNLLRALLVRRHLGLLAYHRGTLRLLWPIAASTLVVAVIWWQVRPGIELRALPVALAASYGIFLATAALLSLDGDDRLIVRAVWEKLRFGRGSR